MFAVQGGSKAGSGKKEDAGREGGETAPVEREKAAQRHPKTEAPKKSP